MSTDALILSIIIDVDERHDLGTADVAGAFLKAFMDDFVVMKFNGESVDMLCDMDPRHTEFVVYKNGTKVLYVRLIKALVRLIKALYGCVKSALLWYNLFHNNLIEMSFVLNPYDSCKANCMIGGKQWTIAWYVDDMKISHADPAVVTSIIEKNGGAFRQNDSNTGHGTFVSWDEHPIHRKGDRCNNYERVF